VGGEPENNCPKVSQEITARPRAYIEEPAMGVSNRSHHGKEKGFFDFLRG